MGRRSEVRASGKGLTSDDVRFQSLSVNFNKGARIFAGPRRQEDVVDAVAVLPAPEVETFLVDLFKLTNERE